MTARLLSRTLRLPEGSGALAGVLMRAGARRLAALVAALLVAVAGLVGLAAPGGTVSSPAAITLDPVCSPANAPLSIAVTGHDFNPDTRILVTFDASRGGHPEGFDTTSDGFGSFQVTITPHPRPDGTYVVRADDFLQRTDQQPFTVPCAAPALTVSPRCAPTTTPVGLVVTGAGFLPSHDVRVAVDPEPGGSADTAAAQTDGSGAFSATVTAHGRPDGTYGVHATDGTVRADTTLVVPCGPTVPPSVSVTPDCAPAGAPASLTATGSGFPPSSPVEVSLAAPPGKAPDTATATSDPHGGFSAGLQAGGRPAATYLLTARAGDTSAQAPVRVPCAPSVTYSPKLRADPELGPPGFTTTLIGSGFPANHRVCLDLPGSLGVEVPGASPDSCFQVDGSGGFRLPSLVFNRTFAGSLDVGARDPGAPPLYAPVKTTYLVVFGANQPPGVPVRP